MRGGIQLIFLGLFFPLLTCFGQYQIKRFRLSPELNEISGLEKINDTLLVAINDGGNKPWVYFINTKGNIIHTCALTNAKNIDWEDLTMDNQNNLYIADCGNNLHNRDSFSLYKINVSRALTLDTCYAEELSYAFATNKSNLDKLTFDCESMFWHKDSLYFLPKDYTPDKNTLTSFALATQQIPSVATSAYNYKLKGLRRLTRRPTAAAKFGDTVAILSYARLTFYTFSPVAMNPIETLQFKGLKQREAIVFTSSHKFYVAAEKHWLFGGPFLYEILKK